jgi:hypothetical protein
MSKLKRKIKINEDVLVNSQNKKNKVDNSKSEKNGPEFQLEQSEVLKPSEEFIKFIETNNLHKVRKILEINKNNPTLDLNYENEVGLNFLEIAEKNLETVAQKVDPISKISDSLSTKDANVIFKICQGLSEQPDIEKLLKNIEAQEKLHDLTIEIDELSDQNSPQKNDLNNISPIALKKTNSMLILDQEYTCTPTPKVDPETPQGDSWDILAFSPLKKADPTIKQLNFELRESNELKEVEPADIKKSINELHLVGVVDLVEVPLVNNLGDELENSDI